MYDIIIDFILRGCDILVDFAPERINKMAFLFWDFIQTKQWLFSKKYT